jgi:hypothetical protein
MFLAYCTSLNGFYLTCRSILWPHLALEIKIWFNLIGDLDLLNRELPHFSNIRWAICNFSKHTYSIVPIKNERLSSGTELQLRSISFSCTWGRYRWTWLQSPAKKDVDFPIPGTSYEKVKSKMHKFNSTNARIPGSAWQTPKQKKRVHKLKNKNN